MVVRETPLKLLSRKMIRTSVRAPRRHMRSSRRPVMASVTPDKTAARTAATAATTSGFMDRSIQSGHEWESREPPAARRIPILDNVDHAHRISTDTHRNSPCRVAPPTGGSRSRLVVSEQSPAPDRPTTPNQMSYRKVRLLPMATKFADDRALLRSIAGWKCEPERGLAQPPCHPGFATSVVVGRKPSSQVGRRSVGAIPLER
jgi:hypothetical protein